MRDITRKAFEEKMRKHGFTRDPYSFMGFWHVTVNGSLCGVSEWNCEGLSNRKKLAWFLDQKTKLERRLPNA